jgi:hypothetical protein
MYFFAIITTYTKLYCRRSWNQQFTIMKNDEGGNTMENSIIRQLYITRSITEDLLKNTPEHLLDIIPPGFHNNIRWNFGHIVYTQEKLVFALSGEELSLPPSFQENFAAGTKPSESGTGVPQIMEIATELTKQKDRIKEYAVTRFNQTLPKPFTNQMGITFNTFNDALLFSFYHEAVHVQAIKDLTKVILSTYR